jgi:hypothetical protein
LGGQDWPKAIHALEDVARTDKNRTGPYLCVFGIAIEKGQRTIKRNAKSKSAYSVNTEVWLSVFFWPFFSNYSYSEIAKAVLEVLMGDAREVKLISDNNIPDELILAFGEECRKHKFTLRGREKKSLRQHPPGSLRGVVSYFPRAASQCFKTKRQPHSQYQR